MKKILSLIILVTVIYSGYSYTKYQNFKSEVINETKRVITVKKWESFSTLNEELRVNEKLLRTYIKFNTPEFSLGQWQYEIPQEATIEQAIAALEFPITDEMDLTFLEGWNIFDYDEYLTKKWLIKAGEFVTYTENPEKITALQEFFPGFLSEYKSLEWFLYPDTYTIDAWAFGVNKLVIKMLENYENKIWPLVVDADFETIYELTTLASIVEKEERNPAEKSTVAGILKKRLNEGWQIGADITVCYPFRLTSEECKLSVTRYLYEKNDYNTRQKTGLPAGPIWNPSLQTFTATLNHKVTPYYYYLHDTQTGKIYYGVTNADHTQNKQLYLR